MELKTGLIISLIVIVTLISVVKIIPVKPEFHGTVYIRADGSVDPSEAPIQRDGDVYTLTDHITSSGDGIVIEKDNIILDGAGYTIQGSGADGSDGINLSGRDGSVIKNVTIKNFDHGILLDASYNNTFSQNRITNNRYGIYCGTWFMEPSNYTIITGNNITANTGHGVYLWSFHYNIWGNNITANSGCGIYFTSGNNGNISRNNITENKDRGIFLHGSHNNISENNITSNGDWEGITLLSSSYNNITGNTFTNNSLMIYDSDSYQNIVVDNTVNDKALIYLESVTDYNVEDAGQVILVNCTGIRVENLSLSQTYVSVELLNTTDSIISGNNLTNNIAGIMLDSSNNNTIEGNNIANNKYGIIFESSSNNTVSGNDLANSRIGMWLEDFSNNTVSENKITASSLFGMLFIVSSDNSFYHNNFIANLEQIHDISWDYETFDPSINFWDDGYPSGGNYWSDYTGVDQYSGSSQNQPGSDFIGDTPYVIDENNVDNYPLMGSWTMEGENVTVPLSMDVVLTFENITSSGITTLNISSTGPDPPSGFKLATTPPMYYDINTTANYTGKIQIRVVYDDTGMTPEEEAGLRLMYWNETLQEWVDITTDLDTENNIIYGEAKGLSLFAVMTPLVHNIAIQDVSPTRTLIGQNRILTIQVAIKNWDYAETFNLTLYANNTEIGVQEITLLGVSNTTITFTWNTTGFAKGNYTISAYAAPVPGETYTEDNIYVDGVVWVKWLYDNTGDGYCGIDDIVAVAERFGTEPGGPPNSNGFYYHPIYDITCDDYIGIDDVVEIAEHFGQTDP